MLHVPPRRTFVIVSTKYVVPPRRFTDEPPYYELVIASHHDEDAARITVITRDPKIAEHAIAREGTEERCVIRWHFEQARARHRRLVVETFA